MQLYLAVTPEHLERALALTAHVAHAAFRIGEEGALLSRALPAALQGGIMVVDCAASFPAAAVEDAARQLLRVCLRRSFSGVVLDTPDTPPPAAQELAQQLQPMAAQYRRRLYVPECLAHAAPGATVLVCTALSGGSLQQRLEEACAQYGPSRIALDLQRLMMEFPIPCPGGEGTPLTAKELQQRRQGRCVYYCDELCAHYFTRGGGRETRFILYDDADTLRRKMELAQALGIGEGFLMWPETEDLLEKLFDKKKEGEP